MHLFKLQFCLDICPVVGLLGSYGNFLNFLRHLHAFPLQLHLLHPGILRCFHPHQTAAVGHRQEVALSCHHRQTMLPPRFREPWDCEMSPPNCIHRTTDNLCGVRSFSKAFLYVLKAVSYKDLRFLMGFPGVASGKEPACQCRKCKRRGFEPWVGKIPWRRAWQHTPVFLPGESHGRRSLAVYSPQSRTELDTTEATQHSHRHTLTAKEGASECQKQSTSSSQWLQWCAHL